jgi:hypothetical protein
MAKASGDLSSPRAQRRVATRLIGSRAAPVGKDRRRVRQFLPSAVMAGFACLRGRTARIARPCQPHVEQRQFYCVKLPRRRTQGAGGQLPIQDRRRRAGSELGRQIPVDLQADADLNEDRGCPGHSSSSLTFPSNKLSLQVRSRRAPTQAPAITTRERASTAAWSAREFCCRRPGWTPGDMPTWGAGKPIRCPGQAATSLRHCN